MSNEKKILIVDDNKELCANLSDILEMEKYEVFTAYDGFQALEKTKKESFDLVLMDIKMPAMNGVETFKKLKNIEPKTPVIMMTAFAMDELVKDALREGAFGCIRKPIDFDKLFNLIEMAIPDGSLIMIVDDNENVCNNLHDILTDQGYRVDIAGDGKTAICKAKENNFDIIILDLNLPILNGLETYLSIRKFRPNVIVIVITGHREDMDDLVKNLSSMNIYTVLDKPLDMDHFINMLNSIFENN